MPLPERRMVHAHLLVDAGAASEPEEQGGIAALTAQMLVTGTRRLDAAAFAEATERLGIEISSESGWDSARAAFATLDRHLAPALHLLAEMVMQPRFDAGEFDRLRAERLNDILQGRADPGRLADELFLRNVYAASTPYRRPSGGVPETVGQLAVDDVRAFHARAWAPSAAHLVIAGGIATDAALRLAEVEFGAWSGTTAGHQAIDARPAAGRRIVLVDRPEAGSLHVVATPVHQREAGLDRSDL
jgi:zinc protease